MVGAAVVTQNQVRPQEKARQVKGGSVKDTAQRATGEKRIGSYLC